MVVMKVLGSIVVESGLLRRRRVDQKEEGVVVRILEER